MLKDRRDTPFLRVILIASLFFPATAVGLFRLDSIPLWLALSYIFVVLYFMGPFILMLHNLGHRPAFHARFRFLDTYVQVVLGPFFGQTPYTYPAHHLGMHHSENNLQGDLSSTIVYRRDSLFDFLRYYAEFMTLGFVRLSAYLWSRRKRRFLWRVLAGEGLYLVGVSALFVWNPQATLVVFVLPLFLARFAMMTGNWAQHAFVDPAAPGATFRNSITCIDTPYNERCFNDGYHTGHHLRPSQHWTELPKHFESMLAKYEEEGAIVFKGLDYFQVWACLMMRRYDVLAKHCVLPRLARPELELLLKSRVRSLGAA